jgi:6,7-dimethyl-8-ribityllumazine synthase
MSETEREGGIFDHEVEADQPLPDAPGVATPPEEPLVEHEPGSEAEPEPEPEQPQTAGPEPEQPESAQPESAQPESAQPEPEPPEPEPPEPEPELEAPAPDPEHAAGGLQVPAGIRSFSASPNGARRSVGIAVSRFNGDVTSKLLEGALTELETAGVVPEAIEVMPVPGAFELPLAAMALAKSRRYSCVLALGCVIRGETPHFDFVAAEAASGVQLAGLETGVPVSFGVLTCDTSEQALARAGGERGNKGSEAARSALEMVESLSQLRATLAS